jgi:hypothetical protein
LETTDFEFLRNGSDMNREEEEQKGDRKGHSERRRRQWKCREDVKRLTVPLTFPTNLFPSVGTP